LRAAGRHGYITDSPVINFATLATAAPRQRRKDARPQELLDAALALFVEKGFAATRSEEVATRAGVAKGTLYRYYPSKDELFKAMVRDHLSVHIAESAAQAADAAALAAERARAVVEESGARLGQTADAVRGNVGSGVLSVRRRANTVVRETKKTTGYVTKESSGLLFWLAMLGGLILFVFVPDKERQTEMWQTVRQLLGELQQMWGDFQADDLADLPADAEYTGDQA